MYYWLSFVMVGTPLSLSPTARVIFSRQVGNRAFPKIQSSFSLGFAIAFASLAFVSVFVPEKPHELASICEKYNSAVACRVW